jgi:glycosyltransferase involved in cell wall biosynthesis
VKLRVLHVYSGNLYGGVETLLLTLARHAAEVPWMETDFALCFEGRLTRELAQAGAHVHALGQVRVRAPRTVFAARRALRQVLRNYPYHVVVCHSSWPYALFAPVVRESGLPLVFYMHDVPNARAWPDIWANQTAPDLVIANSVFTANTGSWLFRGTPRCALRCPVSIRSGDVPQGRDAIRASLGASPDAVVILQASRMQPWKGQRLLLEGLSRLTTKSPWVCWIAGGVQRPTEVAYERELRAVIERFGLGDRVKLLGQREDVPALMQAADVFCQPNVRPEPFGIVFIEALAAGLPVVATAMGGALEIVSASCGILVPPDALALSTALHELVDDPDRRARLSETAPRRAHDLCAVPDRMQDLAATLTAVTKSATVRNGKPVVRAASGYSRSDGRLRVLHIHSGNLWGGVEKYLRTVARFRAHAASIDMEFALCFEGRVARELRAAGVALHMLGSARVRFPRTVAAVRAALERKLLVEHYDVVVCHSAWSYSLFAPMVRKHGPRLVYHMHDVPNPHGWLDRWASLTPPDLVLCYSPFVEEAGRWLFPAVSRKAVPPPSQLEASGADRLTVRTSRHVGPDQVVIVNASRMEPWKGHHLLIDSLARLRANPRWVCWIAGGAQRPREVPYERELHERVAALALSDRVTFLGQRDDVASLMVAADIHCQPNVAPEPFGQAFVEALFAGLPVVTTNMGGARDILNETCGILVPPEAGAVASALGQLIDASDRRLSLSAAGKARARALCDPEKRMGELATALASVGR